MKKSLFSIAESWNTADRGVNSTEELPAWAEQRGKAGSGC